MKNLKYGLSRVGIYLLMILIINAGYLFTQKLRSDDPKAVHMFEVSHHIHTFVTMDALEYIETSSHPSSLLKQYDIRQGRPLYIVQNTIIGKGLLFILKPFRQDMMNSVVLKNLGERIVSINDTAVVKLSGFSTFPGKISSPPPYDLYNLAVRIPVFYFAYIISNIIALLLALLFFEQIWKKHTDVPVNTVLFYTVCWFLLSNMAEKSFFWTAHQQMCSVLSPIFCVWVWLQIADGTIKNISKLFALILLDGILMLYYGNFILLFPSIVLPYLWINRKVKSPLFLAGFFAISAVIFVAPTLLWILMLKAIGVTYYNHEMVVFRQLVWIVDLKSMPLIGAIKQIYSQCIYYFYTLKVLIPIIIWLSVIKLLYGKGIDVWKIPGFIHTLIFGFVCFCFFYLLGFYGDRLTFTVDVSLFCLTPFLIKNINVTKAKLGLLISVTLVWYLYIVFSYGSYN